MSQPVGFIGQKKDVLRELNSAPVLLTLADLVVELLQIHGCGPKRGYTPSNRPCLGWK